MSLVKYLAKRFYSWYKNLGKCLQIYLCLEEVCYEEPGKTLDETGHLIAEFNQLYDIKISYTATVQMRHLKKLRKKLYALKERELMKKYYCIKQHDIIDCGEACLAIVSKHYRFTTSITKIREVAGTTSRGQMLMV